MVLTCRKSYDKDHDEDLRRKNYKKKQNFPFFDKSQTNQSAVIIKSKRSLNCKSFNNRFQIKSFASIGHNQSRSFALQFNMEFKSFAKQRKT